MATPVPHRSSPAAGPAQRAARVTACAFGVLAVAGFVPGLTADLGRIQPAGWSSGAVLLGVLRVSVIGNLIHFALAWAGLLAAADEHRSRRYLLWGGAGYVALSCHRLLVDRLVGGGAVVGPGVGEWLPVAAGLAMMLTAVLAEATPHPGARER